MDLFVDVDDELLQHIPRLLSAEQRNILEDFPFEEEIYSAITDMPVDSAAGPDGFNAYVYKVCWKIIKADFIEAVFEFFAGFALPRAWTSTTIVPIPKVEHPSTFKELRPISLCNFSAKVLSKIIANRLTTILPCIISDEQGVFVKRKANI